MPCRHYSEDEEREVMHNTNAKLKGELDKVTRLLCGTMKIWPKDVQVRVCNNVPGLADWWEEHQVKDLKREKAEAIAKKKKIAKLEAELKALKGE